MKHQVPIGLIYSTQGTYKHMGTNAYLGSLYAIQQINKANSLNIELIAHHRDPQGNLDHYVTAVNDLLAQDINHIFGGGKVTVLLRNCCQQQTERWF